MIFTKLIRAHLLGDFILQPNAWVRDKEQKKAKSIWLYLHVLIHFALAWLFLWDISLWWMAAVVAVSHYLIDLAKLVYQKKNTQRRWFIQDQMLHVSIIAILAFFYHYQSWYLADIERHLNYITGFVFLTVPSSIIIKNLISYWTPEHSDKDATQTESLVNAGKYIGILERLLAFVFICAGHWEGAGFMIAAKSVFRFSDLAQAKQRKLTEYVLIGTLLSFGFAIITGILVKI